MSGALNIVKQMMGRYLTDAAKREGYHTLAFHGTANTTDNPHNYLRGSRLDQLGELFTNPDETLPQMDLHLGTHLAADPGIANYFTNKKPLRNFMGNIISRSKDPPGSVYPTLLRGNVHDIPHIKGFTDIDSIYTDILRHTDPDLLHHHVEDLHDQMNTYLDPHELLNHLLTAPPNKVVPRGGDYLSKMNDETGYDVNEPDEFRGDLDFITDRIFSSLGAEGTHGVLSNYLKGKDVLKYRLTPMGRIRGYDDPTSYIGTTPDAMAPALEKYRHGGLAR